MRRFGTHAVAVAAIAALGAVAHGQTVYQFDAPANTDLSQIGINYQYLGDDVTLPGEYLLNTVTMRFGLPDPEATPNGDGSYRTPWTTESSSAYTPTIQMDIFEIDPSSRLPTTETSLGTAVVDNVTFQPVHIDESPEGSGDFDYGPFYASSELKDVTFDFTGDVIELPDNFAFVYRVTSATAADGDATNESNWFGAIGSTDAVDPSVGSGEYGILGRYNGASGPIFNGQPPENQESGAPVFTDDMNFLATVDATPVPEPTSLALLGLGALALVRRRRA